MVLLIIGLEALEDFDGVCFGRFLDIDFLETADKGTVLFKVTTEFLVSRRTDATK